MTNKNLFFLIIHANKKDSEYHIGFSVNPKSDAVFHLRSRGAGDPA